MPSSSDLLTVSNQATVTSVTSKVTLKTVDVLADPCGYLQSIESTVVASAGLTADATIASCSLASQGVEGSFNVYNFTAIIQW